MKRLFDLIACSLAVFTLVASFNNPALGQESWSLSRTPDGQPDLQGVWTNPTITPMERPSSLTGRAFLTDDEIAVMEARTARLRAESDAKPVNFRSYNQFWLDSGTTVLSSRQTSLVVDPPTGKVSIRQEAEASRDYGFAHVTDSYEYMTVWDRCITRGVPGSMLPAGYNNAYRIVQSPNYITIVYEMIHDVRVIPLDNRPHINSRIRLWMGDSRAHWDGDSLVIETTNYNDRGMIASSSAGARLKGIPVSEELHVIERFTRISEDTIVWEVNIQDPQVYLAPWTISMPLTRDSEYIMFEYACHEGNHAVPNILRGGRANE